MKLGTYVEILNFADNASELGAFYRKLGLNKVAEDVYSDGRYHLRVIQGKGETPTLRYYGCDVDALISAGLPVKDKTLTSPQGLKIELSDDMPPLQLPHDDVASAPETTRLGKFGELAVVVNDLEREAAFWEQCGYATLGKYTDPMPWGIWTDNMHIIGIHQYEAGIPFAITHFDPNMLDVNTQLVSEGIAVEVFDDDGTGSGNLSHGKFTAPNGQLFYLFTGDISREAP